MVSNAVKEVTEQDRRKLLAGFLYDMAKLMFGSVAVGGLSPIFLGNELVAVNYACIAVGAVGAVGGGALAIVANEILKV